MPFSILEFEYTQGTKDSSVLECIGVVEDLWKNIKALSSSPMPHELIKDLNILINRYLKIMTLMRGAACGLITCIRVFSQHHFDK